MNFKQYLNESIQDDTAFVREFFNSKLDPTVLLVWADSEEEKGNQLKASMLRNPVVRFDNTTEDVRATLGWPSLKDSRIKTWRFHFGHAMGEPNGILAYEWVRRKIKSNERTMNVYRQEGFILNYKTGQWETMVQSNNLEHNEYTAESISVDHVPEDILREVFILLLTHNKIKS